MEKYHNYIYVTWKYNIPSGLDLGRKLISGMLHDLKLRHHGLLYSRFKASSRRLFLPLYFYLQREEQVQTVTI